MSLASPIFIHAMWRTGSTYVWKKFRDDRRYRAYLEPLHECLAQRREDVQAACGPATRAFLRHPPLDDFYYAEYPFTPDGGVQYFHKSLSYERYCLEPTEKDEDLRRYIGNLSEHAARHGQKPVFQFNRALLRAAWLAHNFCGVHVLLLRSPLGVWNSFRSFESGYFQTRICTILGQNRNKIPIESLTPWLDFPKEKREAVLEEYDCYHSFAERNGDRLYPSFFDFYLLSMVHCAQYADCILDLDEISRNPATRLAAIGRLRELGIEISLNDCNLPCYVTDAKDSEWLHYEDFSPNYLASTLPPDISISKAKFEANSPLLGDYFRTILSKFVERSSSGLQKASLAVPGQKSEKQLYAIRLFEDHQFERSAQLLGAALTEQPNAGELWNDWASAQNRCGRPHLAELGFRMALRCDPPGREAAGNLGVLLFGKGRLREALPLLEGAELEANEQTQPIVSQLVNRARKSLGFLSSGAEPFVVFEPQDKFARRNQVQRQPGAANGHIPMPSTMTPVSLPARQGLAIFLTGLSGAGKTTIANALMEEMVDRYSMPITFLDGDLVRKFLSSELGFSKEHRDINIRRIGFVAAQVARSGGIAICACIAPYDAARKEVRAMIEAEARFYLVHVSTPLSVCEQRDSKGLYAKARAGLLPQFTGISDPYEGPNDADITIDTTMTSPKRAAQEILSYISDDGFQRDHAQTERESNLIGAR
jgi:adenylyl-sulfate kinase